MGIVVYGVFATGKLQSWATNNVTTIEQSERGNK